MMSTQQKEKSLSRNSLNCGFPKSMGVFVFKHRAKNLFWPLIKLYYLASHAVLTSIPKWEKMTRAGGSFKEIGKLNGSCLHYEI
jgi:hypothetical protein